MDAADSSPWEDVTPVRRENHENDNDLVLEPENHEGPSSVTPRISASNQLIDIPSIQKGERSSRYSDPKAPFGHFGEVATKQLSPRLDKRPRVVCQYHAQGWCVRGNCCRFLHVEREASSSTIGASQQHGGNSSLNDADQVSRISCVYHAQGWCVKGNSCMFLHTKEGSGAVTKKTLNISESSLEHRASISSYLQERTPAISGLQPEVRSRDRFLGDTEANNLESVHFCIDGSGDKTDINSKKVGQVHYESKTLKDFRAELTEFVKELLKPTWGKGLLSREAHKTIVRKAVDKVLSTLEPNQIPSSLESSKLYLSSSQSKLARLVEGYIVKYGNGDIAK